MGAKVSFSTRPVWRGHFGQRRAHVEAALRNAFLDTGSARDRAAGGFGLCERCLHRLERGPPDERANQRVRLQRIANLDGGVGRLEPGHQALVNAFVDEQPPQRRAALARRAHRREGHRAQGQFEVGGGADDGSVIAAKLQDRAGEAAARERARRRGPWPSNRWPRRAARLRSRPRLRPPRGLR